MDEQLEHALEGNGIEAAVHEEAAVQIPSPDPTPEETAETGGEETEVNEESPTEEVKDASAAGLSAEEPADQGADEAPEEAADTEENQPLPGMVVQPPSKKNPPLSGEGDHQNDGGGVIQPNRNIYAEWQELAEAHPEVVGKELPEDIYQACMQSELPPLRVYESMMLQKQADQISALQQEIATLRQNAENTARAPVVAAAEGPANEPEDLFMKGFNSY